MTTTLAKKASAYLEQEGRSQMKACIAEAFSYACENNIDTLIMFTATGEGPLFAAQTYLTSPDFENIRIVAVTPPYGKPYRMNLQDPKSPLVASGVSIPMRSALENAGVEICAGQLLFKPIRVGNKLESEWARVEAALSIMGGGLALCIQAIILACDAGVVGPRTQIVAMTADTAIDAHAARTEDFLSDTDGLIVNHIICRPSKFTISKARHRLYAPEQPQLTLPDMEARSAKLPEAQTPTSAKRP